MHGCRNLHAPWLPACLAQIQTPLAVVASLWTFILWIWNVSNNWVANFCVHCEIVCDLIFGQDTCQQWTFITRYVRFTALIQWVTEVHKWVSLSKDRKDNVHNKPQLGLPYVNHRWFGESSRWKNSWRLAILCPKGQQ